MRGIDLHLPKYPKHLLRAEDYASWEVLYTGGTILCEREGAKYAHIARSRLRSFRIVHAGEILVEMFPPDGATGRNLCYRRRTEISPGVGRDVLFILGWVPMGPVMALSVARSTYRMLPYFDPADPELYPPSPRPEEGEHFGPVKAAAS